VNALLRKRSPGPARVHRQTNGDSVGSGGPRRPKTPDELTAQNVRKITEMEHAAHAQASRTDRLADVISRFCGSMAFVWVHVAFFAIWIVANTVLPGKAMDPYPFSFLTLVVSLEAIFLSTFILISQNRQGQLDARRNQLDLQINLLAEQESTKTLQLLEKIARRLGIDVSHDTEAATLDKATKPDKLLQQIEKFSEGEQEDNKGSSPKSRHRSKV
jgi:uncharacterized membrane protein